MYARPMSSCQISQYAHPSWGDGAVFGTHCEQTHLACLLFMRADRNKSITRDGYGNVTFKNKPNIEARKRAFS